MINLLYGDCLELMTEIPDNSVDMICCDMPYGTTNCKWDSPIDLPRLWEQYGRIAKDNAAIVLFAQTPFDKVLGVSNLEQLRYEIIWEKPAATGFFNAKRMPLKAHENILVFYKKLPTYNPQKTTGHIRKTAGRKEIGSEVYGKGVKKTNYDSTERYPRSVQRYSKDSRIGGMHPTQKPVALIEWLIRTYTNKADTVLDNCMGSGTTGEACLNLDRRFIGMELDREYFDVASSRLERGRIAV
jgi:site-specific DNA-methyltransferase (adenine-specific)